MDELRERIIRTIKGAYSVPGLIDPELAAERVLADPEIASALKSYMKNNATYLRANSRD